MALKIGEKIREVAAKQGLSQKEFGNKINRTKQGVASIYRRSTIDVDLLLLITGKLDYDFFAEFYEQPPLVKFKDAETKNWESKINDLTERIASLEKLVESKEEVLVLQRKYISELEAKLKKI